MSFSLIKHSLGHGWARLGHALIRWWRPEYLLLVSAGVRHTRLHALVGLSLAALDAADLTARAVVACRIIVARTACLAFRPLVHLVAKLVDFR